MPGDLPAQETQSAPSAKLQAAWSELRSNQPWALYPVLLVLLIGLGLFHHLGTGDLKDWDESVYALRALAIVEKGGLVWLDQVDYSVGENQTFTEYKKKGYYSAAFPPLLVWGSAISFHLFGVTELAHRIPTALVAMSGLVALYAMATLLGNRVAGILAVVVLFSIDQYLYYSRRGQFDVWFITFLMWALMFYAHAQVPDGKRRRWLILCGITLGLSLMSKIVIGAVLFTIVVAPWAIIRIARGRKTMGSFIEELMWVGGAALVVWTPWHLYMTLSAGQDFWDYYIGFHLLSRTGTVLDNHEKPPHYYAQQIIGTVPGVSQFGLVAGLLLIPFIIWKLVREFRRPAESENPWDDPLSGLAFALWTFLVPFIIYTWASTKRDTYTLPMHPPLALIVGILGGRFATRALSPAVWWSLFPAWAVGIWWQRNSERKILSEFLYEELYLAWNDRELWYLLYREVFPVLLAGLAVGLAILTASWGLGVLKRRKPNLSYLPEPHLLPWVIGTVILFAGAIHESRDAFGADKGRRFHGWHESHQLIKDRRYDKLVMYSWYNQPSVYFYTFGHPHHDLGTIQAAFLQDFDVFKETIAETPNPLVFVDHQFMPTDKADPIYDYLRTLKKLTTSESIELFAKPGTPVAEAYPEEKRDLVEPSAYDFK